MLSDARAWTPEEDRILLQMKFNSKTDKEIAEKLDRSYESIRSRRRRLYAKPSDLPKELHHVKESPLPKYDEPLVMEGDALVLPDVELPFHDSDFLNRCLDLASAWNIRKCIVAGDFLHFDSLSSWEADWTDEQKGMSEVIEAKLMTFATLLPSLYQSQLIDLITETGIQEDGNLSNELRIARREAKVISERFDYVDFVLGNHESRFIRAIHTSMMPAEILKLIEVDKKWRVAPYYYSRLVSDGEEYLIEHPGSAAKNSAYKLAAKFQCHVIQAHSHRWNIDRDISGKYWAIHMGCVVDERRLPYASQRHNPGDAHRLGACIVREGYPFVLGSDTPWKLMEKMV